MEHEPPTERGDPDVDRIFRRLTEIRSKLDSMPDVVTDERLALESERARLRRRCQEKIGGKDTGRSVEALRAELGERRRCLGQNFDMKIRNTGLYDSSWNRFGTRAVTRASFEELNEGIDEAQSGAEVRDRISEIVAELRRRGAPTD